MFSEGIWYTFRVFACHRRPATAVRRCIVDLARTPPVSTTHWTSLDDAMTLKISLDNLYHCSHIALWSSTSQQASMKESYHRCEGPYVTLEFILFRRCTMQQQKHHHQEYSVFGEQLSRDNCPIHHPTRSRTTSTTIPQRHGWLLDPEQMFYYNGYMYITQGEDLETSSVFRIHLESGSINSTLASGGTIKGLMVLVFTMKAYMLPVVIIPIKFWRMIWYREYTLVSLHRVMVHPRVCATDPLPLLSMTGNSIWQLRAVLLSTASNYPYTRVRLLCMILPPVLGRKVFVSNIEPMPGGLGFVRLTSSVLKLVKSVPSFPMNVLCARVTRVVRHFPLHCRNNLCSRCTHWWDDLRPDPSICIYCGICHGTIWGRHTALAGRGWFTGRLDGPITRSDWVLGRWDRLPIGLLFLPGDEPSRLPIYPQTIPPPPTDSPIRLGSAAPWLISMSHNTVIINNLFSLLAAEKLFWYTPTIF